jgi:3-dehydroquinate dehydratase-2
MEPAIILLQGANLKRLGTREPHLYGTTSASELDAVLLEHARQRGYRLEIRYADTEREAIQAIRDGVSSGGQGLVMNPGGFTETAYELQDFLSEMNLPYIELHITNLAKRGIHSILAENAAGLVMGFGLHSYILALEAMQRILSENLTPGVE